MYKKQEIRGGAMVMYYTQSNVLYPIVGTTGQVKSQNYIIVPLQWVDAHT